MNKPCQLCMASITENNSLGMASITENNYFGWQFCQLLTNPLPISLGTVGYASHHRCSSHQYMGHFNQCRKQFESICWYWVTDEPEKPFPFEIEMPVNVHKNLFYCLFFQCFPTFHISDKWTLSNFYKKIYYLQLFTVTLHISLHITKSWHQNPRPLCYTAKSLTSLTLTKLHWLGHTHSWLGLRNVKQIIIGPA